jgi:nicotinamide mononucleotide transporter
MSSGKPRIELAIYALSALLSAALLIASHQHRIPSSEAEVWGFVTGGVCVWLAVKENIWNWPIGLANNAIFFFLFLRTGLYGDMALQLVQFALGAIGWYIWLFGGENRTEAHIVRASRRTLLLLGIITVVCTEGLRRYFVQVHDSAPFLDAFTTVLSLVAQGLLTRKFIENWHVWIFADAIYIGLYAYKNLYLTSVLYAIFLAMCVVGLLRWRRTLAELSQTAVPAPVVG